jgi:L-asparagine transporter-like permease
MCIGIVNTDIRDPDDSSIQPAQKNYLGDLISFCDTYIYFNIYICIYIYHSIYIQIYIQIYVYTYLHMFIYIYLYIGNYGNNLSHISPLKEAMEQAEILKNELNRCVYRLGDKFI